MNLVYNKPPIMVRMTSVGQLLRETRESKNLTIKQVSNIIKIRESLLEALENGEYTVFTSDMHLKSFLRSYASYLGINEEKILAVYRRERQIDFNEDEKSIRRGPEESNRFVLILSKVFNLRSLITVVTIGVLAVIIWFFYSQWRAFSQPPTLQVTSPKQNDVITTDSFVIEGFTDNPSVKVILDGNEANYVNPSGQFRVNAKFTEPGSKRFTLIAKNEFSKQTEVTLDLTYQPPVKEQPKTQNKIRIVNKSAAVYTVNIAKDKAATAENIKINPNSTYQLEYNDTVDVKNFDKAILDLYFNEDATPTTSIDSKDFSIIIENNRPIVKVNKK